MAMDAKTIYIYSFSRNKLFSFPAYLIDFSDNYKSAWKKEIILGKMDPIATFSNTARTVNLSFEIPCENFNSPNNNSESYFDSIQYLIEGMYPIYDESEQGRAILASPPMFRVRFANLIRNSSYFIDEKTDVIDQTLKSGLLCYIENFDFKPKVDSGFFVKDNELYPKLISVNLILNIIHEFPLGHKKASNYAQTRHSFENFPYKKSLKKPEPRVDPPPPPPPPRPPGGPPVPPAAGTTSGTATDGSKGINNGATGRNGGDIPGKTKGVAVLVPKPKGPTWILEGEAFDDYMKRRLIGPYAPGSNNAKQSAPTTVKKAAEDSNKPKEFESGGGTVRVRKIIYK